MIRLFVPIFFRWTIFFWPRADAGSCRWAILWPRASDRAPHVAGPQGEGPLWGLKCRKNCHFVWEYVQCIFLYMYMYIYIYIHSYIHTLITLHYITLHYITLHYITLHCIALHYITLHYITFTLHYITYITSYIHITFIFAYCT